jgi:hypothetical protein
MTDITTASQRGRANRRKGADFQRAVARAIRPWFPDAISGRENGHRSGEFVAADDGDLARTSPGLWWSLKDVAAAATDPPGLIAEWMREAQEKSPVPSIPLVVQKRKGHSDPLRSWCWLDLFDLAHLLWRAKLVGDGPSDGPGGWSAPLIRMELRDLLPLLAAAGYAEGAAA